MNNLSIEKGAITVWKIRATFLMAIVSFICGAIAVFSIYLAIILFVVSFLIYIFLILFYFNLRFKCTEYMVDKCTVLINKGVFLKKCTSLFKSNIQFVEVIQSPIQRKFDICTVVFHMAGKKYGMSQINLIQGNMIKDSIGCDESEK